MKKSVRIFALAAAMLIGVAGCSTNQNPGQGNATPGANPGGSGNANETKLEIVTTIFPEYDWVREIVGDANPGANITLLQDGVDLHSYQPSAADIIKIATADVFIYVGGESDEWVDDVLKQNPGKDRKVINLMEVLGDAVKTEEFVEGMQGEDEHDHHHDGEDHDHDEDGDHDHEDGDHDHDEDGDHDHEDGDHDHDEDGDHDHEDDDHDHEKGHEHHHHSDEEEEYDEHVWLSLKNAKTLVSGIAEELCAADPSHAEQYGANKDAYLSKLSALDAEYEAAVAEKQFDTVLFADRFPFRYMMDDYGIKYYAAFIGCSAETEACFETVTFLAGKVDELNLDSVCIIENSDGKIADTVIKATNRKDQEKVVLNSLQSVTKKDSSETYLSIMEENLKSLTKALGVMTPDVDLTQMSSTMVYASVYNMVSEPEKYKGKCVRMSGTFYNFYDEYTEENINACLIEDATACCQQGVEFVLKDPNGYPADLTPITVTGTFETYEKNGYVLCRVDHAVLSANR